MQHDQIIVPLPFIKKTIFGKRIKLVSVGFDFTNKMLYIFRDNNNLKDNKDFNAMVEKNGQQWLINESLYCAALAYCQSVNKEPNFDKESLLQAVFIAKEQIKQSIMDCWQKSQTFGASFKKKDQTKAMNQKK